MKNRRIIYYMVLLISGIFYFPSCQYETIDLGNCTDVSFPDDIQPIFDTKCVSCHAGSSAPAGLDLTPGNSYNALFDKNMIKKDDPGSSELYLKAKSGHNGAVADDACKILAWIKEGALEGEPLIDSVVYNDDIQPIFDKYCISCHDANHTLGIDLTSGNSYQIIIDKNLINTDDPGNSKIYTTLTGGHYDGAADSDYETIYNWIDQGAVAPPVIPTVVSFADNIQPIFDSKCTGCHSGPSGIAGLDLTSGNAFNSIVPAFIDTVIPENSIIYVKPDGTHSANYSTDEASLVLIWIKAGAEDNK